MCGYQAGIGRHTEKSPLFFSRWNLGRVGLLLPDMDLSPIEGGAVNVVFVCWFKYRRVPDQPVRSNTRFDELLNDPSLPVRCWGTYMTSTSVPERLLYTITPHRLVLLADLFEMVLVKADTRIAGEAFFWDGGKGLKGVVGVGGWEGLCNCAIPVACLRCFNDKRKYFLASVKL